MGAKAKKSEKRSSKPKKSRALAMPPAEQAQRLSGKVGTLLDNAADAVREKAMETLASISRNIEQTAITVAQSYELKEFEISVTLGADSSLLGTGFGGSTTLRMRVVRKDPSAGH